MFILRWCDISVVACSSDQCEDLRQKLESKSFFEEKFWLFIIPSAIILTISIILNFLSTQDLLSQTLAFISIIFSGYGVFRETIEDLMDKKITANLLMVIAAVASFFILHGQEGATAILLYSIAE